MIAETYLTSNILKNKQLTKTLKPASFRFFLNKLTKALFINLPRFSENALILRNLIFIPQNFNLPYRRL